ncbi:MAG: glycosyl transferase family protein [Phycisphaerales bacterium]|nr:glycosyl transferase family protein [Phycisphaerales bacterium]
MTLPLSPADSLTLAAPVQSVPRRPFRDHRTLPLLLLLTLIAGVLRFVSLDRPSVWGDEAATYGRVGGTYQELLDQLADSSFPPLHYEAEWWIAQGMPYWGTFDHPDNPDAPRRFTPTRRLAGGPITLTPFALRFIPAAAGTLFVPAIFFLAVQLFGRRIALTAAALACFSAYALVFSRDAKMYMHFWLFVTLHVACALWWVRTRRSLAWACWVLCGLIMVGLHGSGFVILLIDALIVFTSPRQYWFHTIRAVPLGFWTSAILPNRLIGFVQNRRGVEDSARWYRVARQRSGIAWQKFRLPVFVPFVIGVLIIAAAAQGPLGFYSAFSRKIQGVTERDPAQVDLGELGIGWVGIYNQGRTLPSYLLYTSSAYLTGWEWPRHFPEKNIDDQARSEPRTLWLLQTATVSLLGLLTIGIVPWRRLFQPGRSRADRIFQDGRVWRPVRTRRVLWLGLWLTMIPWVTYSQSTQVPLNPLDGVAKVFLVSPPTVNWPRLPVVVSTTMSTWEKSRQSFDAFCKEWPAAWRAYSAAWTGGNLSVPTVYVAIFTATAFLGLVLLKRRAIGWGTVRLLCVILLLLTLTAVIAVLPRKIDSDVWLPRYLGTILPAFFVFIAVLIDRQPVLLRWLTIGLFVLVNMGQFSARVWGYADPPTGLMAADVVAAQPKSVIAAHPDRPTFRAYAFFGPFFTAEPGGGTLFTPTGRYYLRTLSGVPGHLLQVRFGGFESNLQVRKYTDASAIESDLKNSPEVQRFVVWTAMPFGELDLNEEIGDRLYGRFRRVNDEVWPVRDHWRWYDRFQVRRRTYERVPPTTASASH